MSSFIYPGTTVTAGNGLAWFINDEGGFSSDRAGILGNTTSVQDVLQDNLLHYGYLIAEDDGHTFWTPTTVDPSYVVHQRQIYISDTDGWARIVDSYTNLGVYLTRSLDYSISFEGLGDVEYISSDALPSIEDTDFWVIASDSSGLNTGAAGLLLGDSAELTTMLANAHTVYGDVTTQIPFGETLSFMTFVLKGQSVAEVQADMNDLLALAPGTLDGLSAEQIDSIVNWDLPTAALTRDGTAGADVLAGTDTADSLNGAAGNDVLLGDDGDDLLSGGTGRDTLHGGNGNDVLWGNDAPYVAKAWAAGSSFNADISFALLGETVNSGTKGSYSALIYPDQDIAATLYDAPLDVTFVLDVTANSGAYYDMEGTPYGNSGLAAQIAAIEAYLDAIENGPKIRETYVTLITNGFDEPILESFWTFSVSDNDGRSSLREYLDIIGTQPGLPSYDLESALIAANDRYASGAFADRELVIFATSDLGNLGYLVPELNTLAYNEHAGL